MNHPNRPLMVSSRRLLTVCLCALLTLFLLTANVTALNDADGDGVEDSEDDCPETAEGADVDSAGCSESQRSDSGGGDGSGPGSSGADGDEDGVDDDEDACPSTPTGTEVNSEGCPDSDRDGVIDEDDQCPDTPHSERREVDETGCTPFFDETFVESAPLFGRITNANAISFGTVSMVLGGLGWAMRAGRVIGLTGGSSKRRKRRFLRRINKAKHSNDLEGIRQELNKANEKSKLPDGAFSDLITALEQRLRTLSSAPAESTGHSSKPKLRPSSKPPSR